MQRTLLYIIIYQIYNLFIIRTLKIVKKIYIIFLLYNIYGIKSRIWDKKNRLAINKGMFVYHFLE